MRPIRAITRFAFTLAIVNGVIGSAIFGMPAQIAGLTGAMSPYAHVIAAIAVLSIVLCFAEVASRFDESGGAYLYAREAFGPHIGFQAGWLTLWTRLLSAAANLNVFVDYLGQVAPRLGVGNGRAFVIVGVLTLISTINIAGVKQGSWTINVFTTAKLLPLIALVLVGLSHVSPEILGTQAPIALLSQKPNTVLDALGLSPQGRGWVEAILLLVFAFGGFEAPLMAAGEAKNARKDSAFALLVALAVIATVYVSVQYVTIGVVPELAKEKAPIAAAFREIFGPGGVWFASLAAMISVWGWAVGNGLQSPRLLFSMAERGDLPRFVGQLHPGFKTPAIAIVLFSVVAGTLAITGTFEGNAVLSAIVRLLVYASVVLSLFKFRKVRGPAGFVVPAAPLVATVALVFCGFMLAVRPFGQAWIILATMAAGHVLWFAARK